LVYKGYGDMMAMNDAGWHKCF